jgi:hypothetical protein
MTPWKLPLVVAAIAVPVVAAFYLGGPGFGVAAGALVAVAIVVFAVRQRPRGELGQTATAAERRRVLVVVGRPLEDPATVREVATIIAAADAASAHEVEVLVLSPARIGFLDRWASDLERARREAQQHLVIAVAALAKAGVAAEARVGDEDVVQAVEDQLGIFAATDVVLVAAPPGEDPSTDAAAEELQGRLRSEFRRLTVDAGD